MITRVRVKNFRSLENVDVTLERLTVLVGRNGAGKSNFVDCIQFVQDALRLGLDSAIASRNGLTTLRRWTARGRPFDIEINLSIKRGALLGDYSFVIGSSQGGEYKVKRESCRVERGASYSDEYEIQNGEWTKEPKGIAHSDRDEIDISPSQRRLARQLNSTALFLPSARMLSSLSTSTTASRSMFFDLYRILTSSNFYSIYPNTLREIQKFSTEIRMGDHGENLAAALRNIKKRWDTQRSGPFPDFLAALKRVVDDVSDLRVKQLSSYLVTELKHEAKNGKGASDENSPWFELSQQSDGTLRILGLLVGLYQSNPNIGLIAIEEPELNLHPGALAVLADVLHEASERRQLLLTTQSPDLISRFQANQLRVTERINGATNIGVLEESQRNIIEQQLFTAGDLLRIEGLCLAHGDTEPLHA